MPSEAAHARFVQKRVALFGRAFVFVAAFSVAIRFAIILLLGPLKQIGEAGFLYHLAGVGAGLPAWLLCRSGERSVLASRTVETFALLSATVIFSMMAHALTPVVVESDMRSIDAQTAQPELYAFLVDMVQQYFTLVALFALTAFLVLRSALVPGRPLWTVAQGG